MSKVNPAAASEAQKDLTILLGLHMASPNKKNIIGQFVQRPITRAGKNISMRSFAVASQETLPEDERECVPDFVRGAAEHRDPESQAAAIELSSIMSAMIADTLNEAQISIAVFCIAKSNLTPEDKDLAATAAAWLRLLSIQNIDITALLAKTIAETKKMRKHLGL